MSRLFKYSKRAIYSSNKQLRLQIDDKWFKDDSVEIPPIDDSSNNPVFDKKIVDYARKPVTPVTLNQLLAFGSDFGFSGNDRHAISQKSRFPDEKIVIPVEKKSQFTKDPLWKQHRRASSPANFTLNGTNYEQCDSKLIENANFLRDELPVRLAKRVSALQNLPFIVGVNPFVKAVRQLYHESFNKLASFEKVKNKHDEVAFSDTLTDLVNQHNDTISVLARGFGECSKYMSLTNRTRFLDEMIRARIGIRVLAEHYLALHDSFPNWVGIIHTMLSPASLAHDVAAYVAEVCELHYGSAPTFEINGHVDTTFAYVPVHLEYMLTEVLKNSMRATVEHSQRIGRSAHPPVLISIAKGQTDITIRIRDYGGGIPYETIAKAWEYSYTTAKDPVSSGGALSGIFDATVQTGLVNGSGGPMAGLGFGLPMTKVYASYFGGSFDIESVYGNGCDVFFRVPNISLLTSKALNV